MKDITIGILAWKSPETLRNTLDSYKNNNLFSMVHPVIFFQERTPELDALAASYGIHDILGTNENVGILSAFAQLIQHTKTKYFIFAECDFELIHTADETSSILDESIRLMEEKGVDLVRLRDRVNPGVPLGSRAMISVSDENIESYKFEPDYPFKIEILYFIKNPEEKFPGIFEIIDYKNRWYKISSEHAMWSNNIFIAKMDFLKNKVLSILNNRPGRNAAGKNTELFLKLEEYLSQSLKDYTIAAGIGLFKHNRLDR
jgi:hypothetical protein